MIGLTINDLLEEENVKEALDFLMMKKDACGTDGMMISDLPGFLNMNESWFWQYWNRNNGKTVTVKGIEILSSKGKKRTIYILNSLDRLIGWKKYFRIEICFI